MGSPLKLHKPQRDEAGFCEVCGFVLPEVVEQESALQCLGVTDTNFHMLLAGNPPEPHLVQLTGYSICSTCGYDSTKTAEYAADASALKTPNKKARRKKTKTS